jgi:hypothetical protein
VLKSKSPSLKSAKNSAAMPATGTSKLSTPDVERAGNAGVGSDGDDPQAVKASEATKTKRGLGDMARPTYTANESHYQFQVGARTRSRAVTRAPCAR